MTEPVYFKKDDVVRMWGHGHEVSIAKDCGVYIICWDPSTPHSPRVDMASGYLEDGFYLEEIGPRDERPEGAPSFADIWDASRAAVGGDDFCDPLPDPIPTMVDGYDRLAVLVKEDEIEMWWAK